MRFGRELHRHTLPEWDEFYVDYNGLKKLLKSAGGPSMKKENFLAAVSRDARKVETLFLREYGEIEKRTKAYFDLYGLPSHFLSNLDNSDIMTSSTELDDILAVTVELRNQIKKLQWFGHVNRDGIIKLFRKFKEIHKTSAAMEDSIDSYQFVNQTKCFEKLQLIDQSISRIKAAEAKIFPGDRGTPLLLRKCLDNFCSNLELRNALCDAVHDDNCLELERLTQDYTQGPYSRDSTSQLVILLLLQSSYLADAVECVSKLSTHVNPLKNATTHPYGNFLHLIIASIGRRSLLEKCSNAIGNGRKQSIRSPVVAESHTSLLSRLLDGLNPKQRPLLFQEDSFGHSPLHYAAQYGLSSMIHIILSRSKDWGLETTSFASSAVLTKDIKGNSPLDLAIFNGDLKSAEILIDYQPTSIQQDESAELEKYWGFLLLFSVKAEYTEISQLIASKMSHFGSQSTRGETALYIAVRSENESIIKLLMDAAEQQDHLDIDQAENTFGWTPLIAAAVSGNLSIVELLLSKGANPAISDQRGWLAKDHAAFRGFWPIVEKLSNLLPPNTSPSPRSLCAEKFKPPPTPATKSRIFVNLGSSNSRKPISAVDLGPLVSQHPYDIYSEVGYSMKIDAIGASGSSEIIHLPLLESGMNRPFMFETESFSEVKLAFKIFDGRTSPQDDYEHIGTAIALLENLKAGFGTQRESLIRDYTIPILGKSSLDFIGSLTFNFIVVNPLSMPKADRPMATEIWKSAGYTQVVGHRGFGMNVPNSQRMQIGENTMQAFLTAMDRGLSYIECDVQLTKDHVPVIYHDYLVSESGADLPTQALTIDQFMHLSKFQTPHAMLSHACQEDGIKGFSSPSSHHNRSRSRSVGNTNDCRTHHLLDRMKQTFEFKLKGFKGNIRGDHIHDSFTTLEEMLKVIPDCVGFDIELKYPMLWEAEDWGMDFYGVELNAFIDAILEKVYAFGGNRAIVFTSFSPEMCILISQKQDIYPILFLNESGLSPTGDIRASTLQEAINFAKSWSLPGIVMASEPFLVSPKLVKQVKDAGLVCGSFGGRNDNPEDAKAQAEAGVDAIIVDSVNLISNTFKDMTLAFLHSESGSLSEPSEPSELRCWTDAALIANPVLSDHPSMNPILPPTAKGGNLKKYACTLCVRRKVKCDKHDPCSACVKSQSQCIYQNPAPSFRHRKRPAQDELLSRLTYYEELLRANNIQFDPYDSSWIPSSLESKLIHRVEVDAGPSSIQSLPAQDKSSGEAVSKEKSLWADLSNELQNPPRGRILPHQGIVGISPKVAESPEGAPSTDAMLLGTASPIQDLAKLHPPPKDIFKLWQIFLDSVNPFSKIIHIPTMQQQILEAAWNIQNIPKEIEAIMFAIYGLAISVVNEKECLETFKEEKSTLENRYLAATKSALVSVKFASSQDLRVLQALTLLLLLESDWDSDFVLCAVAIRLGQRMGLHIDPMYSKLSFFEKEMRIRLWWQIGFLNLRQQSLMGYTLIYDFGEPRLPLNVNDSDLHPDMAEPPTQHTGTTEMLYCLMRYEVRKLLRESPITKASLGGLSAFKLSHHSMAEKDALIDTLERMFEQNYLKYCDPRIPFHHTAMIMAQLAICNFRFMAHHPRHRANGEQMDSQESNMLFSLSVRLLKLDKMSKEASWFQKRLSYMTSKIQIDALIYTLSELRQRTSGDLVSTAWQMADYLFAGHPDLINDTENTFYTSLVDLAFKAWDARQAVLVRREGGLTSEMIPKFISALKISRQKVPQENNEDTALNIFNPEPSTLMTSGSGSDPLVQYQYGPYNPVNYSAGSGMPTLQEEPLDWAYWDEFLQDQFTKEFR